MKGVVPLRLLVSLLVSGLLLVAGSVQASGGASLHSKARKGGTFKVSFLRNNLDYVDPALSYTTEGWSLLHATCARLMNYPDKPRPEGLRLVPEVAASYPRVSRDGRRYTFTLRTDFRFSDGTPVRASAFAHAINRSLTPGLESGGLPFMRDIVGAEAVRAGRSKAAAGVVARGNQLDVRFKRPVFGFAAQTSMPAFCAVPPTLPTDPEGVGAHHGSGPYYIAEYVRGERVVLMRNRFYRGTRPHHVDRFVVDLRAGTFDDVLDRIERGQADWGYTPAGVVFSPSRGLARKYGVNRSRFYVKPGMALWGYHLNVSRPLFRNNVALRKAVNFALDRPEIVRQGGLRSSLAGRPTDQYLQPGVPGFRDVRIYPVDGPDVRRANALARGHRRSGKAELWTWNVPGALAAAQVVKRNLKQIGLDVDIKGLPIRAYFREAAAPGASVDIALGGWIPDYVDPSQYINPLFDGRYIGEVNLARLNSPKYNAMIRRAARLQGDARYQAYGQLDVQLARDAAPMAAVAFETDGVLVSSRVGCVLVRPGFGLNLTAACLK
jgi:ABC-type oligopeptide transport system substrate-binding subunit